MENSRVTMTAKEAAKYLGVSYWLLLELTKKKEIKFIAAGGRKLFRKETLDEWLTKREASSIENMECSLRVERSGNVREK